MENIIGNVTFSKDSNSNPHIVSEPTNHLDIYRRLQIAEGKLHEIEKILNRESISAESVKEIWIRNEYDEDDEPFYIEVDSIKKILIK